MLEDLDLLSTVNSAVLIQGETGTGKDLIARAIHEASSRRNNRFVSLNCAAIPAALLESELFGHERGAFTGALAQTIGRFQAADRGTLFLDEIGDLPIELQPKLLRALQEKQFERVGGNRTIQTDVRVIAATNQDLPRMVQNKTFRADLFYRLNVFPLSLPPLRERREDIPLLVEHFVKHFAKQQGKVIDLIPQQVLKILEDHDWPGNIRELQNVIERGVIMTNGRVLSLQTTRHMIRAESTNVHGIQTFAPIRPKTLAEAERAHIKAILRETNGVVGGPRGAAVHLGVPRTTLLARMQRLGIHSSSSRGRPIESTRGFVSVMAGANGQSTEQSGDLRALAATAT